MTLTPELQKMFDERTKKLSKDFHDANCCNDQPHDFEKLKKCLDVAKKYINHFQDYHFPPIQNAKGLESMVVDLKMKNQEYQETCMEFNDITTNDSLDELSKCLKITCNYIQEIELDLKELGFSFDNSKFDDKILDKNFG